jgi:IclR family acetate operon transcriptional repressor
VRGYAVDDEEHEIGVRCIAVALRDEAARVAISISGPASRLSPKVETEVARTMVRVANELDQALGIDRSKS